MNRPVNRHQRALAATLAAAAGATLLVACGSDEEPDQTGETPTAAPRAKDFPKATGTLTDVLGEVDQTDQIVARASGGVFEPGDKRFGFGLFDIGGEAIDNADVAIYAANGPSGQAEGPFPARIESLATQSEFVAKTTLPTDAKAVYVANIAFDSAGDWRLVAVVESDDGLVATPLPSVIVRENKDIPDVGEPAPKVHTPTLAEVGGDVESIDTRVPPSTMHGDDLAEVLGKEPVVLLFATPALCQSRVCGPVVDVAEQVKSEYGDEAAFIHQEIYVDNEPPRLRSQVKAFGLFTEPWLFVIDKNGDISTRIEGAFSVNELEHALEPVVS